MQVALLNHMHYAGDGMHVTICDHERKGFFMLADEKKHSCVRGFTVFLHQKLQWNARDTLLSRAIQHAGIHDSGWDLRYDSSSESERGWRANFTAPDNNGSSRLSTGVLQESNLIEELVLTIGVVHHVLAQEHLCRPAFSARFLKVLRKPF